jgi:GNAT superfamily N-acetyltransferase
MRIRAAEPNEDGILVDHYIDLWRSYGVPERDFMPDAAARVRSFLRSSRLNLAFQAFLAEEEGTVLGSVWAQERRSPYPEILKPGTRRTGYIGSMYVVAEARGKGVGKKLLAGATDYLGKLGCRRILLHTSDAGRPLYESFGFRTSSELGLELDEAIHVA